ncbi:MAG: NAD(P)-dependent glycerol-3-phosphate dehydrogenase [Candidatus Binatia bacterium]|nr:NAD(P)-dependent glycerol-3-phosphate dehydrogenase [Candidatus Binatia bacterium]
MYPSIPCQPVEMGASVIGAGSWGTALAMQLARAGHSVSLWARDAAHIGEIQRTGENKRYLNGCPFPEGVHASADLEAVVRAADELLVCAVPSHAVRETLERARPWIADTAIIVSASKGIEEETAQRMSEVISQATGAGERVAVLSGPSFAREVAEAMPTALTAAASNMAHAEFVQHYFASAMFRVYALDDVIGVEVGGAVKNVIAIATGVSDGLGLGHNARAALITRGLTEISRLAARLGGDPLTVSGLSGMGDLVLTCTGSLSRNRSVGLRLGEGESLKEILGDMQQVAEGVRNTLAIDDLARDLAVELPITSQMRALLFENKTASAAMVDLMSRQLKPEFS